MSDAVKIVVPWHNPDQLKLFLEAWKVAADDPRFHFEQDKDKSGCAKTKNKGVMRVMGTKPDTDVVIVLDDDCYASFDCPTVDEFIAAHLKALEPQEVPMFAVVTDPQSRGTPYLNRTIKMPVAGSMGFWTNVGDYDAAAQLVHGAKHKMTFDRRPVYGRYFAWSGMNVAFRPDDWWPWWQFIDVPRFDDIWSGLLFQSHAYRGGYCFNLGGPLVRHSRQSNVWANLRDEAKYFEQNETLWQDIFRSPETEYENLLKLLPCHKS